MKALHKIAILVIIFTLVLNSCSRKKNSFISRNYHAVTAEYNSLYNGYNALNNGVENLNSSYIDNYWEILPVEPMQVEEDVFLPGQSKNPNFERAEEKAVKAIQKHSMNIEGKENNPQMDEAYLLLGKARYYDQRFIPALEAFNYVLYKYPASDKINHAKVWREKTNIRLENDELALKNLKRLLEQEELSSQDLADATSMLAQAYLNLKHVDSALIQMKIASNSTKRNEQKGRFNFIKGQLYNALGEKDSANMAFDQVIDLHRKIQRIYYIAAHLEKVKNFDFENGNKLEFTEYLTELEENRENRPFLDKIYHQIGEFYNTLESDSIAEDYYNKSLRTNSVDKQLKALNYQRLGDMSFDKSEYVLAGAYFDSTMLNLKQNSKLYRNIKRKRENLEDVIFYEGVAKQNDSILNLVSMPETERLVVIELFVNDLKEKAEALKEKQAMRQNAGLIVDPNSNTQNAFQATNSNSQSFYFYNPTTVAFGKNEFIKIWGDRPYKENWRLSKSGLISDEQKDIVAQGKEGLTEEEKFNPEYYISLIPTEKKDIDSIQKERNFAYYQLGLIYKNKFSEFELSKNKLNDLLKSEPEDRLILPAKYNLYKVYLELDENAEAEIVKSDILKNHAESRYAMILSNPDLELEKDKNSPEVIYENLYKIHEEQDYEKVIAKCNEYIDLFEGENMVPKFEFLKATATGRLRGFVEYKDLLNYIALNYPNSPEGKKAEKLIQEAIPLLSSAEFVSDEQDNKFKVVYPFYEASNEEISEFQGVLNEILGEIYVYKLHTSKDVYDKNTTFVVVHGLRSINGARGFLEFLGENKEKISRSHFPISSQNYQIIQIHKNLESYLESQ